jgi:hypothetical protein
VHLNGEQMTRPAPGHHRDRGDAGQAVVAVTVEERLEQAGIACLVGGRREDRDARGGDPGGQFRQFLVGPVEQARGVARQVDNGVSLGVWQLLGQGVGDGKGDGVGP